MRRIPLHPGIGRCPREMQASCVRYGRHRYHLSGRAVLRRPRGVSPGARAPERSGRESKSDARAARHSVCRMDAHRADPSRLEPGAGRAGRHPAAGVRETLPAIRRRRRSAPLACLGRARKSHRRRGSRHPLIPAPRAPRPCLQGLLRPRPRLAPRRPLFSGFIARRSRRAHRAAARVRSRPGLPPGPARDRWWQPDRRRHGIGRGRPESASSKH